MGMLNDLKGKVLHEVFKSGAKFDLTIGRIFYFSDEAIMLRARDSYCAMILTYEQIERLSRGRIVALKGLSRIRLTDKKPKLERV